MRARLTRTFKAFTYRDYRLLWAGAFTSSVGTWMQKVAQSWLVLTTTGSSFWLGLDAFLADAPFLLFSLFGGVLADRWDRRKILLGSQAVQMSSAFVLTTLLLTTGTAPLWVILSLSFVVGLAQSFGGPAYQALVPTLVDKPDLPNAVALNSIQFNLARVIGPVLAGIAFYELGAAACFGLNGLSFIAVIFAILALKGGALTAPSSENVMESLKTGLRAVRDARKLRGLVGLAFAGSFCAMPLTTFLPVFAKDVFGKDAKGYSTLLSTFGCGAVLGAIGIAGIVGGIKRKGRAAVASQLTFGALLAGFSVSRIPALSYVLLFLCGTTLMCVFALFMTLVQTSVEDGLRGRVVSVYSLAFRGAMPLGNLVAGVISSMVPAPWVLCGNGLLLMSIGILVFLRNADDGVLSL